MSIFSKLLGSSKEHEIRRSFLETRKRVERECKPLSEVGLAIVQASTRCRDTVKDLIVVPNEKERLEREIYVFYEFIYFYMHMTMRHAFAELTPVQIKTLQNYLSPLISSVAIDSYFAHWPEELKQKMTSEFYDKLNDAEVEYAQCTKSGSPGKAVDELRELFMKLGANISALTGHDDKEIAVVFPVSVAAMEEWKKMGLDKLIADVARVITNADFLNSMSAG